MFLLMSPATARRRPLPTQLVHGTAQLTRVYATHR